MKLSKVVEELLGVFEAEKPKLKGEAGYSVSRTVSVLAVLYEKARNAVEFRAEHLIRRAAIERILKRLIILNSGARTIAENLVTELLWARYIDSSLIDEEKIEAIKNIITRYLSLKQAHAKDTILGLASSEIDETLVPARKREALIHFCYQAMRPKITLPATEEQRVNIVTYIAVERAFAQADDALISFHLLKMILPSSSPPEDQFWQALNLIQSNLHHPTTDAIYRYVRRYMPPFLLIRDFFLSVDNKAKKYLEDETQLDEKLTELTNQRYQEIGTRVRRAIIRSFVYIFLTKMVFALALEVPYDLYIIKKVTFLPLIVNTLFPPLMLFAVAGLFSIPGPENTRRLIDRVKKILYRFDDLALEPDVFIITPKVRRPVLTAIFSVIYLATFGITFGLINLILTRLNFNLASQLIFIFFVAMVSFFAYRIRQSAKEYEMGERQGIAEPVLDFFLLPVLRAGHFLSREIARLNIFIFIFDFILEAPLKVMFEVVEEWIRFIRTKKEEII